MENIPTIGQLTRWSAVLDAMASPVRLAIVELLDREGEQSVGELNSSIPLSQSALSQHLRVLRQARLVATRRDAQQIYYRLDGGDAKAILNAIRKIHLE